MIVPVIVGTVGFILIMAGRTGWDLLVYLAAFAIDVVIALTLAQPDVLGIRGAAIAQACTLTFSALARLFLVRRFLGIWPFDGWYVRLVAPAVARALVMFGIATVLPSQAFLPILVLAGGAGVLVYGLGVFGFALPPNERAMVRKVAAKVGAGRWPARSAGARRRRSARRRATRPRSPRTPLRVGEHADPESASRAAPQLARSSS